MHNILYTVYRMDMKMLELILLQFVPTEENGKSINNVIRGLVAVTMVIFFAYAICFAIQTSGIERGTDLYMRMMYPGIIPLIPGTLLEILLKR